MESFNGRVRDERVNDTLFSMLAKARSSIASGKEDYHHDRAHSAIGNMPTDGLAIKVSVT